MSPTLTSALSMAMLAILSTRDGMMPCQPNRPSFEIAGMTCMRAAGSQGQSSLSPGMRVP